MLILANKLIILKIKRYTMSKKLLAKHDKVIIKPIDSTEQLYGNIVIPDLGKEKPEIGEVVSVGPGRVTEFGKVVIPTVQEGDTVIVPKIGTIRIDFESEEYYIIQDREILAVIKEENE
jgi:chaperonin GroES